MVTLDAPSEADARRNPAAAALDGVEIRNGAATSIPTAVRHAVWPKVLAYIGWGDKVEVARVAIKSNARQVRIGASIIGAISLICLLIAVIVMLVGGYNFLTSNSTFERSVAFSTLMGGFGGVLAALVLRAGAAYMRMISFTCDLLSESLDRPSA
jgi:hypothetical protein